MACRPANIYPRTAILDALGRYIKRNIRQCLEPLLRLSMKAFWASAMIV